MLKSIEQEQKELKPVQSMGLQVNIKSTKPAITFLQKVSLLTLRIDLIRPHAHTGELQLTRHSYLYEVDKQTQTLQHRLAYEGLTKLVFETYAGNVKKALLIDNVTDTPVWGYKPDKGDRFPFIPKFDDSAEGHCVLSGYRYYQWISTGQQQGRYDVREVNLVRDWLAGLQEKIELNIAWHKKQWQDKLKKQIAREMPKQEGPGAVEVYNRQQVFMKAMEELRK